MIKIEKVNKYFNRRKKNEIHVINDTTLTFDKTGLVALLGPSGSGKTTLLNVIGGLDKVNKGKIYINGERITKRSMNKIDKIRNLNVGYIFQDYKLVDDLTVFDNVALVLKTSGIKDKKEIKTRVNYVLETLNIYRYRNRYANMLSGGERQRVGIARAIVSEPDIIIADEPTGNLDSKHTLEIMNIIKSISKNRLVILVTHESDLAKFYASRVIELEDGKVISDYANTGADDLDYRLENNIYLKDFKNHNIIKDDNVNIELFSDNKENIDLNIIVKNGNIYINSKTSEKLELIDENSDIKLLNENYKKIDKTIYEKYEFNFGEVINKNIKKRYSSIFNLFTLTLNGFKKIFDYSFIKKVLLLGFFAASMFILLSYSRIFAALNIEDKDFVTYNKNYLQIIMNKINVDDYLEYEKNENVDYLIPGNSHVSFIFPLKDYYQTMEFQASLAGSLSSTEMINKEDIIIGRMPTSKNEIVIDLMNYDQMMKDKNIKQIGINTPEKLIGRKALITNMEDFTIVGIVDLESPSIYVDNSNFINILTSQNSNYYYTDRNIYMDSSQSSSNVEIFNYELFKEDIIIKKGKEPINDYEIIVSEENSFMYPLNKNIDEKINDTKLKVVGYYSSNDNMNYIYTNNNTVKYKIIENNQNITVYPKDKEAALAYFREKNLNINDTFELSKKEYMENARSSINSTIIVSSIVIAISLIEIFLMIRASFLSRIKEIGIYRAIGVKKSDIYKMFASEIGAITIIACFTGTAFMAYILKNLSEIVYFKNIFLINPLVIILGVLTSIVFNLLVGLIPVYNVLRKTPANILARHDI